MVQLSDNLTAAILKKSHNSFVKHKGPAKRAVFSTEPNSLSCIPHSGLSKKFAAGVVPAEGGNAVLTLKTAKAGMKPAKGLHNVQLRIHGRGTLACNKTIKKVLGERGFPASETRKALARLTAIARASRRKAAGVKYTPKSRTNKA